MKRIIILAATLAVLAGCGLATPKDEAVCLDMVKLVTVDPKSVQLNKTDRLEAEASIQDLENVHRSAASGSIPPAMQRLLDSYKERGVKVKETFISLDVTFDGRLGKVRDGALCRYFSYEGNTELASFTIQGKDINQNQFFEFFLMRDRPKGLDSRYRL